MSNYKPRIESNNLDLTSILSTINELPDAAKPEQTKTATPSLSQQTITPDSGKVLSGVTIAPITFALLTSLDPDFKAENIVEGVNMFGLVGTGKTQMSMAWVEQYSEVYLVCFNEGDTWGDFLSSTFNERHFSDGMIAHYYNAPYGTDYIVYESMAQFYVSLDGTRANRVTMTDAIIPNNVYRVYDNA